MCRVLSDVGLELLRPCALSPAVLLPPKTLLALQCASSGWLVMNGDLPADLYAEQKASRSC